MFGATKSHIVNLGQGGVRSLHNRKGDLVSSLPRIKKKFGLGIRHLGSTKTLGPPRPTWLV